MVTGATSNQTRAAVAVHAFPAIGPLGSWPFARWSLRWCYSPWLDRRYIG